MKSHEGTRVKICGITRLEDALVCAEAGADLLGFVFAPSPRHIEPEEASRITEALPGWIERVGVFVDETVERIRQIVSIAGLTMVQLHGSEPPEMDVGLPVLRALRVRGASAAEAIGAAGRHGTPYLLIEPSVPGRAGGTGKALDWGLARDFVAALPERLVFLAGGLGPDNVSEALRAVRPYGVDASSRLEESPGRKDHGLVRRFVETVRGQ